MPGKIRTTLFFALASSAAVCASFASSESQSRQSDPQPSPQQTSYLADPDTSGWKRQYLPEAPSLVGTPIFFEGPMAGRYPNRIWFAEINASLEILGFRPVDSCASRLSGTAYAYVLGCDGKFHFVNDIYKAAAAVAVPPSEPEPEPKQVAVDQAEGDAPRPRKKIEDIVDRTVPLRMATYGAIQQAPLIQAAPAPQAAAAVPLTDDAAFVDSALGQPVPRTLQRSATPKLLPIPTEPVADPLPGIANARVAPPSAPASGSKGAPRSAAPKVVEVPTQVEAPEKIVRPKLEDFLKIFKPKSGEAAKAEERPSADAAKNQPAEKKPATERAASKTGNNSKKGTPEKNIGNSQS